MTKRAQFLRDAEALGWQLERRTGSGHIRLTHPSGAVAVVASSPGGSRAEANERALLRRLVTRQAEARA